MNIDLQYLNVLRDILDNGTLSADRTSVGSSIQTFSQDLVFDTKGRYIPFIQHRDFGPKTSFKEFIWMMRGQTDANILKKDGVRIWDDHSTREFLDSRNLQHLPEGSVGKSYGYQFRSFGGETDQLARTLNLIKNSPTDRDMTISIWNPNDLDAAPLKPCSYLYEFMLEGDKLNLYQHMRSADMLYGVPYNLSFGTYLLFIMAKAGGFETGKIKLNMTNAHIYTNQVPVVEKLLERDFNPLTPAPIMYLEKDINTVEDIENLDFNDFTIEDFVRGEQIQKVALAV